LKHSFIDKYSELDSPVHRLDARLRLIAAFAGILIMVSVPRGQLEPFILFFILITGLVFLSRIPLKFIAGRCLIVAPFILISAAFYPISSLLITETQHSIDMHGQVLVAISIAVKAFLSVLLVILLVSTGRFHDLLHGMRRMKIPKLVGVLSAMMYRYIFIIYDEALRTIRARDSRTPGKLVTSKIQTYGNQAKMIFLRSWNRSQIVYQAMLSRGFTGEFPVREHQPVPALDMLLTALVIITFVAIRLAFFKNTLPAITSSLF
jgi:cobalt/nickel transport system permease protein